MTEPTVTPKPALLPTATVTIDRQDRRNALDVDACERLAEEIAAAPEGGSRAIVLTGAGPHFCAGADLALVAGSELAIALRRLLATIEAVEVPIIAAVAGAAYGAGTQLAIACDLRVVAPTARFAIPAAKLGLMVDHWTVQRLARLAGHGPARAMLLAAHEMDATEALRLGFAQRGGDLEAARGWAKEIAALAPLSVAGHKLLLNGDPAATAAYDRAWSSADMAEGLAAFGQRRPPHFEGR
ncbi:MAG: enoyl-CoA hydratase [Acidimicrobiaceae bacterium]|nr:enoyl-CoA hydratase [Acidimicrobiaceae bacterium]